MSMKKDVVCASTKNISCTHGLNKCWVETLPALLGHITLRGADNVASCKLLGNFLSSYPLGFHQWSFFFMQTNDLSKQQPWEVLTFPVISGWKNSVFLKVAIFSPGTLYYFALGLSGHFQRTEQVSEVLVVSLSLTQVTAWEYKWIFLELLLWVAVYSSSLQ
jgi:hypothetical protein